MRPPRPDGSPTPFHRCLPWRGNRRTAGFAKACAQDSGTLLPAPEGMTIPHSPCSAAKGKLRHGGIARISPFMSGFGTIWPESGPGNPSNLRNFRHSQFVARLKGQPQRQTPDAEPQGSGQTSGGKSAGHGKKRRNQDKSARREIRGDFRRALFLCPIAQTAVPKPRHAGPVRNAAPSPSTLPPPFEPNSPCLSGGAESTGDP